MCPDCGKPKMQFESERKAQDFIKWNADEFKYGGDSLRIYYCKACCCYHISHKRYSSGYGSLFNNKMAAFEQERANSGKRLDKLIRGDYYENVMRQAHEVFHLLSIEGIVYQPEKSVKQILNEFFKAHDEYQDSHALRSEIMRMYYKESRKINKKRS